MARATRSSAQADKDKPQGSTPAPRKPNAKKRKRTSNADADTDANGEQPSAKQPRTEDSLEPEEQQSADVKEPGSQGSGDVPIEPSDAQKILDVLEVVDTQGLLDRVFPLPTDPQESTLQETMSTPSAPTQTYSLRALLKDSSHHPLRVLRSAIQHLFPISSHPRSRPSAPAAQQLRFCDLALSLLDLASFHSVPTPLEAESIFPALFPSLSSIEQYSKPDQPPPSPIRHRKYALVQRLPTGDWWTSLNSEHTQPSADGKELKDLPTAHADLAAILPAASTSNTFTDKTLEAYVTRKPRVAVQLPGPRRLSCGRFLDYGPYASFAPTFDQEGVEVGQVTLGEVIWYQREKTRLRERIKGKQRAPPAPAAAAQEDVIMLDDTDKDGKTAQIAAGDEADLDSTLGALLPPDEVERIKSALGSLEMEQAVQELLDRNTRALLRLQRLQRERLGTVSGGLSKVEEGSDEWDTAQAIIDSLTLLASLRPRSSKDDHTTLPPLIPSASVLRTLQRTLPASATEGWYGTLPASRTTALRDDTTIHVKTGAPVAPPATATAAAAVTTTATVTPQKPTAPATSYTPYSYSNYTPTHTQYRGGYGAYTPQQGNNYYSNYATTAQGQTAGTTQYPNTQYNTGSQYPYQSWYGYQHGSQAQTANNAAAASGGATPQPATTPSTMPTSYAGFFASTSQQQQQPQQPQRAVANTVMTPNAAKGYQSGAWSGAQSTPEYVAPTLPPHIRPAVGASTPGTAQLATSGAAYSTTAGYYGHYPPAQSPAPTAR